MRRLLAAGLVILSIGGGLYLLQARRCPSWQESYKRFLYVEMMKTSPVIYTLEDIDRIIGTRPTGCERPPGLTSEDGTPYRGDPDNF